MSDIYIAILGGAFLTYLTRIGGHLILSRFEHIHPRVEAALNAVPAAVLTTLVAPAALTQGWPETVALIAAALAALRLPLLGMVALGWAMIVALRWVSGG
jgi:uncharacterized membrane protein